MTTLLITGASGYLGRNLVRHLSQQSGNRVVALIRPGSETTPLRGYAEICTYDGSYESISNIFSTFNIDLVIHLAALATYETTPQNIAPLIEANLTLGTFVLQAMAMHGCRRLINTGTYWQHYQGEGYNPVCLYAAMKEAFEKLVDYYVQAEGLSAITLQLTDVYGPHDPRKKVFHLLDRARVLAEPLKMTAGAQLVNLVYIQDAVDAYVEAARRLDRSAGDAVHERFFVAALESKKLRDIVELYVTLSRATPTIEWGGRPYRKREVMVPFIGERLPHWQTKVGLEEGLKRVLHDAD